MRILLDTSVILAACSSTTGASALIVEIARPEGWTLQVNPYAIDEVERNLGCMPGEPGDRWRTIKRRLAIVPNVLTVDRPVVFEAAKDRPILYSALAFSDVLLTLDVADFGQLLGSTFYGLRVVRPADFLRRERLRR